MLSSPAFRQGRSTRRRGRTGRRRSPRQGRTGRRRGQRGGECSGNDPHPVCSM